MAFTHSKASRVFVNEDHASAYVTGYTLTHARALSPVTSILDDGEKYIPGQLSGGVTVKGLFDSASGGLHEEINAVAATDNGALVTVVPDGSTIGSPAFFCAADLASYAVDAEVKDAVTLEVEAVGDDGVDWGVCLHAHGAETADVNSASVNNAASSANGGVAVLHVTAYSGLTNAVIKVQHSTNDSVWSDLVTFTTVTAVTSQRSTVTGTVNQYLRATVDVTGTGSVTYLVAFARR